MSASDVEVFRRFHEAWTAGDLETALAYADPDVVARPLHGVLYSRSEYHGFDGLSQWYTEMTAPYDCFQVEVERVWPTSDGVVGVLHLVGRRGGEALDARVGAIARMRDGRIISLRAREAETVEEELRR
jgi:ketosteroid isomerase-like protein